jgi:hypothetical protein
MAHKKSHESPAAFVPAEENSGSSYSPDGENIDGRIVERESTMGENERSACQKAVVVWTEVQATPAFGFGRSCACRWIPKAF